jgi:hypothetical protein
MSWPGTHAPAGLRAARRRRRADGDPPACRRRHPPGWPHYFSPAAREAPAPPRSNMPCRPPPRAPAADLGATARDNIPLRRLPPRHQILPDWTKRKKLQMRKSSAIDRSILIYCSTSISICAGAPRRAAATPPASRGARSSSGRTARDGCELPIGGWRACAVRSCADVLRHAAMVVWWQALSASCGSTDEAAPVDRFLDGKATRGIPPVNPDPAHACRSRAFGRQRPSLFGRR